VVNARFPTANIAMQVFLVLVAIATGAVTVTALVSMDGPNPWRCCKIRVQHHVLCFLKLFGRGGSQDTMQVLLVLVAIATGAGVTGLVSMDGPNPWTSNGVNAQQPNSRSNPSSSFTANAGAGAVVHVAAHRGHPQPHEGCPRPQICVPRQEMGDAPNKYVRGAKERRAHEKLKDSACVGKRVQLVSRGVEPWGRGTVCPQPPLYSKSI
jgi:hypothetical protein